MSVKKRKDESPQDEKNMFNEESHKEEVKKEVKVDSIETIDATDTEPVMPVSAVEEMLKTQEERWNQKFSKLANKFSLGLSKKEMDEGASYIADLTDDWMDNPVVFFAFSINFSIHGDKKMGVESSPPQGAIKFNPIVRTKKQGRRGEEVISVSSVKVQSKSVAEYLRNHSQFGIAFFEDMESVLNINSSWAQKLVEANTFINRMSDQKVIARCKQEMIPIGTDITKMRKALVEKVAEKSMKHQESVINDKIKKSIVDPATDRVIVEK